MFTNGSGTLIANQRSNNRRGSLILGSRIEPRAAIGLEIGNGIPEDLTMQPGSLWLVVGWIALHFFALASACGTRIAAGSYVEKLAQLCFFVAMAAIGAGNMDRSATRRRLDLVRDHADGNGAYGGNRLPAA